MYYYEPDEKRGRRAGAIAAAVYVAAWIALMLFASMSIERPDTEQGILVNFGSVDDAGGKLDMALSDRSERVSAPKPQDVQPEEPMLTSEEEDAPEVVQSPKPRKPQKEVVEEQPKPREANPKALFPGLTQGSQSKSEGQTEGEGNQGVEHGSLDGAHTEGGGMGSGGVSFDLAGRQAIGQLLKPLYNSDEEGKVVVSIMVDAKGNVTAATRAVGTSIADMELVGAALKAARQARFSAAEGQDVQRGTITYVFRRTK